MAENTAPRAPEIGRSWYKDWLLLSTVPTVLFLDQISKLIIKNTLVLGESWPAEGLFRITYGTNTGTAFGLFPNQTVFLIIASFIAIGFLVYFYRAHALPRPMLRFAIGLQLGGALGNLLDRIFYGSVVDFIDVGWWPIFNLADSSIVVGMAILVGILVFFEKGSDQEKPIEGAPSPRGNEGEG
ncbi:MAG: signal peptidase II [Chloroflexi bacterium]|nr:signal peptidase II [Chloroflexota bacterium]